MSAAVVAVLTFKGGVGKTTTAVHLAHRAATQGQRVLLIDMDGQGMAGKHLGVSVPETQGGVYELLVNHDPYPLSKTPHIPLEQLIIEDVRPGLDLIVNDLDIEDALIQIERDMAREEILHRRLLEVKGDYDLILLDTQPTSNLASLLVLFATNYVLAPVEPGEAPLKGLHDLKELLGRMDRAKGHMPYLLGVVATRVDHRTRIGQGSERRLKDEYRERFAGTVRERASVKEGPGRGQTLFEYDPGGDATADYRALTDWLLAQLERHQPQEA